MKKLKKISAALIATALTAGCAGMLPVNAISVNDVPGLDYEVTVTPVNNKRLAVTLNITKNPGLTSIGVGVRYDNNCIPDVEATDASKGSAAPAANLALNYSKCPVILKVGENVTKPFSVTFYYDLKDTVDSEHTFSTCVYLARNASGSLAFSNETKDGVSAPDATVKTESYNLGDIDNNEKIEITDAQSILEISNTTGSTSYSVSAANKNLSNLKKKYPKLVCGEVADVNRNGLIEEADAKSVLTYYSESNIGSAHKDTLIGSKMIKVIEA